MLEGQPLAIFSHHFNVGDLWFVLAAIAWAIYSLLLKNATLQTIPTLALFFVIALRRRGPPDPLHDRGTGG